jgi:histidinol-phosphatase (PHP family)
MANSGLFNIVGHLDLVKVFGYKPKQNIKDLAKNAIKAIKKNNMAVEINTAGLRKPVKEIYPSTPLLEMVRDEGIEITFSSDAHNPDDVGYEIEKAIKMAKNLGFREAVYFEKKQKQKIKL